MVCDDVPTATNDENDDFFFMSICRCRFFFAVSQFFRFHHLVFLFMVENKREPAAFLCHTLAAPTDGSLQSRIYL